MRTRIPSLTIQPLVENAIYHGIELLPDGGEVTVSGMTGRPVPADRRVESGRARRSRAARTATRWQWSNIRQRFELAYGSRASVSIDEQR